MRLWRRLGNNSEGPTCERFKNDSSDWRCSTLSEAPKWKDCWHLRHIRWWLTRCSTERVLTTYKKLQTFEIKEKSLTVLVFTEPRSIQLLHLSSKFRKSITSRIRTLLHRARLLRSFVVIERCSRGWVILGEIVFCLANRMAQICEESFSTQCIRGYNTAVKMAESSIKNGINYQSLYASSTHVRCYADVLFSSNDDLWSQIGLILLLCYANGKCRILVHQSCKFQQVIGSTLAAGVFAFIETFDAAYMMAINLKHTLGGSLTFSCFSLYYSCLMLWQYENVQKIVVLCLTFLPHVSLPNILKSLVFVTFEALTTLPTPWQKLKKIEFLGKFLKVVRRKERLRGGSIVLRSMLWAVKKRGRVKRARYGNCCVTKEQL